MSSTESLKKDPNASKKVVVVLTDASLETIKTKHGIELVTSDTHALHLKKINKNPADYRPDIVHQALLQLLDSPLNKAGHLDIYIQTTQNVLIHVSPHVRLPRTFKRFGGLIVQLLYKLKVRASDGPDVLLKVIKNPITDHLPVGSRKFATSSKGELVNMNEFAAALPDEPVVFAIGCTPSTSVNTPWTERTLSLSQFSCSSTIIGNKVTNAFETKWGIL